MKSKLSIIFVILPFLSSLLFSQDIKVLSSDRNSLIFEFVPIVDTSSAIINNEKYIKVNLSGGSYADTATGMPWTQFRLVLIGVPSESGNNFQVVNSEFYEISGKLAPIPQTKFDKMGSSSEFAISDNYNAYENPDLLELGNYDIIRSVPVQKLRLNSVQFFANENKIRIYNKITIRVNFNRNQKQSDALTDDLFSGIIINYDVAKHWSILEKKLNKTAANSVLSGGTWKKFLAPTEGIYKIDRATLAAAGFDPNTTDPRTVKIYNNSGRVLPEPYNLPRPGDLTENAVLVNDINGNTSFDEGEYVLFYGRGIHFWEYDSAKAKITRYYHPYSSENYYWITAGGEASKRMQIIPNSNLAAVNTQTESDAYVSYEEDKLNKFGTGRLYVGDEFSYTAKSRTYTNLLEGLIPGSNIYYNYQFLSASSLIIPVQLTEGSSSVRLLGVDNNTYDEYGRLQKTLSFSSVFSGTLADNRSNLKITYNSPNAATFGYLDFFEIKYRRNLTAVNDKIIFYSEYPSSIVKFELSDFSNSNIPITVFDISDYSSVKYVDNINRNMSSCSFTVSEPAIRSKYIALTTDKYLTPSNFVAAENSNLRGESTGASLIIITPKAFRAQAERLKNYKESQSKYRITVAIAEVDHIFNEFSGGLRDVTAIRDYVSYAFNNWQIKPEYVLLLGDGDYDYKNLGGKNLNFIIPYESVNSLSSSNSYATDDYYVALYNKFAPGNTGNMPITLAVGRVNAQSEAEASAYIDKIIEYESAKNGELWNSSVAIVSDDRWHGSDGYRPENFLLDSESLSNSSFPNYLKKDKIYSAAYTYQVTSSGTRIPDVTKDIIKSINNGVLILNFFGHGAPNIWTDERIFESNLEIPKINNDKYFFLCATTCSFGLYDDPEVQSGTEQLLLKSKSGSILGVAASKSVDYTSGKNFNVYLLNNLLLQPAKVRIGKAMLKSKSDSNNDDYQKFHLFGDPTLFLDSPEGSSSIDLINDSSAAKIVKIKALSPTKINGTVLNSNGTINTSFNGECIVSVYEGDKSMKADGDSYLLQGGLIFKGKASVTNGRYSVEFITPKDVSYDTTQQGKIVAYYYNDNEDGIGYTKNIKIGGTDTTQVDDGKGPMIDIYFNDLADGGANLVNPDFTLLVKLNDETGLNTTGAGIGHKLEAVLNDDVNNPVDLTNYYIGDLNSGGKSGQIKYDFLGLEPGSYKIQIKALDIFNNISIAERNFTVTDNGVISIKNLLNYPNPFSNSTMFTFQHNIAQPIDVKIKIYSVAGRMIQQIEKSNVSEKFVKIDWNGRDRDGNEIGNGAYIYKLIIKSIDGSVSQSSIGKIAVVK